MNFKKKIRVGIAGYGLIGKVRFKELKNNKNVKIICVSDKIFSNKLEKKKFKELKKVIIYDNFKDVINQRVDAVFVCLPNKFAAEASLLVIKKNLHLFCEKPPARNLLEFKKIYNLAKRKKGIKIKYGFNHRYHSSIILAKKIIDSKKYGKLINAKGLYGKSKILNFEGDWRSSKKIAGGGILLDQGIHLVDLLRHFCGEFSEVKSFVSNKFWNLKIEDNAYAIMRSNQNVVAMLHSSATKWLHEFRIELMLEKAQINLKGLITGSRSYGDETMQIFEKNKKKKGVLLKFNKDLSWKRETSEFINCLIKNKKIQIGSIFDSMKVMELISKIYKSDKF